MSKSSKRGIQAFDSDKSGSSSKGSEDSFERDFKPKNQSKKVKKIDSDEAALKSEPEKKLRQRRQDPFDRQLQKAMELSLLEASASTTKIETPTSDSNQKRLEEPLKTLPNTNSETISSPKIESSNSVSSVKPNENVEKPSDLETKESEKDRKSVSSNKVSSFNEKKDDPVVIELDEDIGNDSDDFKKKEKTKKKATPAKSKTTETLLDDQEKKTSASKKNAVKVKDTDDDDEIEKVDKEKKKAKKKKALRLSDSEEDDFKPNSNKSNDEEKEECKGNDSDDEDFSAKKKTKKTTTKKKTSPEDKEKKTTKKKTEKENVPELNLVESNKDVKKVVDEEAKPFVVTPFVSKTVKQINAPTTINATSTPDVDLINSKSTSKLENKPVNKFLTNTSLLNTSATSSGNSSPLGRIEIKTPSFARVGLSRNFKVKPLHPNAKPS